MRELAGKIDFTNINQYKVTDTDCEAMVLKARVYGIPTVVATPASMDACRKHMAEGMKLAVSACYPSGAYAIDSKRDEIEELVEKYPEAESIYAVMGVGLFVGGETEHTKKEVAVMVKAAGDKKLNLITEASLLTDEKMALLCDIASEAGVHAIVTSTGFVPYDVSIATAEDAARLVKAAAGRIKVIAYCKENPEAYLEAGCDRLFTDYAMDFI